MAVRSSNDSENEDAVSPASPADDEDEERENRDGIGSSQTRKVLQLNPFTSQSLRDIEKRRANAKKDYGFIPKKKTDLPDNKELPPNIEPTPASLFGRPVEDVERMPLERAFCVVTKRFSKYYMYRFTATRSLFLFHPWNPVRVLAIRTATHRYFDYFVMATILLNCVFLAMSNPIEETEYVFLTIYTIEMIIKSVARGFILNKYTYLRNPWNWLDFIVILIGYITIVLQFKGVAIGNIAGLRTFRVLRALKTVSIMPGLKVIVNAMLRSVRMLAEVMTLTLFCLMVFALLALQLYQGILRQQCVRNFEPEDSGDGKEIDLVGTDLEEEGILCGNATGTRLCPMNYTCMPDAGENPNSGYTNFDNFGWSMLNTLQILTLDFWEDVYDKVIAATGPMSVLFFLVVVFYGSFYLVNLTLAVVAIAYEEEAQKMTEVMKSKYQEKKEEKKSKFLSFFGGSGSKKKETKAKSSVSPNTNRNSESSSTCIERSNRSLGSAHRQLVTPPGSADDPSSFQGGKLLEAPDIVVSTGEPLRVRGTLGCHRDQTSGSTYQDRDGSSTENIDNSAQAEESARSSGQNNDGQRSLQLQRTPRCSPCWQKQSVPKAGKRFSCKLFTCSWWSRFRSVLVIIVEDPLFDLVTTVVIVVNTLFLAAEHHGMPKTLEKVLRVGNGIFTTIFTIEALLKILALGKRYFKSKWNVFDLIIVIFSLVDLSLETVSGLSVLRTFRLLRVLKLAQAWSTMRLLLTIIASTLGAVGNMTVVLAIIVYIFAVLGMQLFSDIYTPERFAPNPVPRWNFSDFVHSLMMVFRVLCGEWVEPLWDCMEVAGDRSQMCLVVFLSVLVVGNFLVLNLFLALLLNSFNSEDLKEKEEKEVDSKLSKGFQRIEKFLRRRRNKVKPLGDKQPIVLEGKSCSRAGSSSMELKLDSRPGSQGVDELSEIDEAKIDDIEDGLAIFPSEISNLPRITDEELAEIKAFQQMHFPSKIKSSSEIKVDIERKLDPSKKSPLKHSSEASDRPSASKQAWTTDKQEIADCCPVVCNERCFRRCPCLPLQRVLKLRKIALRIVEHKIFEWLILILIFASSILLCFEDVYLPQRPEWQFVLEQLNLVFTGLFLLEVLLKWAAWGLVVYFSSFWSIMDFLIVCVSVLSIILESAGGSGLYALRAFRTLRALRPLRAISRWQGMRIVVNALVSAIPSIINVLLVCIVFWLIFGVMGVQFFGGRFFRCVDEDGERIQADIVRNKDECFTHNGTWVNSKINFDNVGNAYLALFQVATFEGWMEIMEDATDTTMVDQQPDYEANLGAYVYFVAFIICGSFFTLNLFIGVIIDNFNVLKKKYEGGFLEMFLTDSQRTYYTAMQKLGRKKPQKITQRPRNKYLAFCYDLSVSRKFEVAILLLILLNLIVMTLEHHGQPEELTRVLEGLNILFTTLFTIEAVIKMLGLRHYFFTIPWNVFDFVIIITSILGIVFEEAFQKFGFSPTLLRVIRVFRIGRVLRLVKAAKGIRKLLFALIISLPALFNIGALLFLITFIYGIIGMSMFGHVKLNGAITDTVNFQTFANSMLLLFRLCTAAGWNDILDALMIEPPDCDPHYRDLPNGNCGLPLTAVVFLVSYIIINYMVIINMYIAVILENLNQANQEEETGISEEDIETFYVCWSRYDPHATQFILFGQLSDFLSDLDPPLGIPKPNTPAVVAMDLPIADGNRIHCLDILHALTKMVLGDVEETEEFKAMREQMDQRFSKSFPTRSKVEIVSSTSEWKRKEKAAKTIQSAFRNYKRRKQSPPEQG